MLVLAACVPQQPAPPVPAAAPLRLTATVFSDLAGWQAADAARALSAFRRSCRVLLEKPPEAGLEGVGYAGSYGDWRAACSAAAASNERDGAAAHAFFEQSFVPYRISQGTSRGLFTGYYEPELRGSRTRHGRYQTPLYGLPRDLVLVDLGLFRDTFKGQRLAGRVVEGRLVPYPPRAEIVRNGLPEAKILFYVDDPIDAFFLQIQGSGRVILDDGSIVRAVYAGQNGQPYTAIGGVLVQRGELTKETVSMQTIKAWLLAHPDEAPSLMNADLSYVFFSEQPIGDSSAGAAGAEGVALTPEASLAVDTSIHGLGVPVFVEATAPDADATKPDRLFDSLLVMQDSGGAIRGAIRGDVYWGFGAGAAAIAGRMKNEGTMTVLLPKTVASRLGARKDFTLPP